ncbi:MAG TPA: aminotransferase class I/II-fold pyridoxal phosphate-dependent enzyme [Pirellulales bacterium]|nr:aminotransferase class I/II-fold pyridoxal phosphate-dependent enzyme [Pirellulales bacterium]
MDAVTPRAETAIAPYDLAIFGAEPRFPKPLHVGRPNLGDRGAYLERIDGMLQRQWLTNDGELARDFERRVAELVGVRHCVAMCNATVALEIVIRALGMTGEVIIPSFTFIATAHALQWQQITPVFCDVAPGEHHLDPERVEELITPRTSGIIGVHVWGDACDVEALEEIARRRGLRLLFDAAHAFGCSHQGRMIGSFGNAEVFSFHATKFLNTLEGGAVVTNDDALADQIRLMRNFGFVDYDKVIYIGTNGKMNEASAAMGLTNLDAMDDFVDANLQNYRAYQRGLEGIRGVTLRPYAPDDRRNYQYVVLEIDRERAGLSRDDLLRVLRAENVLARRYFYPGCHRMEPYRSFFPHAHLLLPHTEALVKRVLLLPTGTSVTVDDAEGVCQIVRNAVALESEVRERLAGGCGAA